MGWWDEAAEMIAEGFSAAEITETVTVTRGTQTGEIEVTWGQSRFEMQQRDGSIVEWVSEDLLCATADYKLDDVQSLPARMDRIVRVLNGQTITYEVFQDGQKRPYELSCQDLRLRVHCKRISNA